MFRSDQYRQMAEEAARLAEAATNYENRVIWLKIAVGYRELAAHAEQTSSPLGDADRPEEKNPP